MPKRMPFLPAIFLSAVLASEALAANTTLGPHVVFTYDETSWTVAKAPSAEAAGPMYEATLQHPNDPGVSLFLWTQTLNPEEVAFFAAKSGEARITYMADMVSKKGTTPTVTKADVKATGPFAWAHLRLTGISGQVSDNFIASVVKDDFFIFVVWTHDPRHTSTPFDLQAAEREFITILGATSVQ